MEPLSIPKYVPPEITKFIDMSLILNTPVLIVVFVVFVIVYFTISIILMYHWSRYGMKAPGILIAEILYVFVSASLFLFASLALSFY